MSHTLTTTTATPSRHRLLLKYLMFPGTNWVSRDKSRLVKMFMTATSERPVRTLDCGCGNAYFTHQAALRGSTCLGITIHEWEKRNCEEMRDYLGFTEEQMDFRVASLSKLAKDPANHKQFNQVLLLDVIEHILDARKTLREIHDLLDEDGFVYISTPDRDWQGNADHLRVTPVEDGWHVRNGFTFEQLERLLEENGFEPIDRLKFGSIGSTLVTRIQHKLFGRWIDPLTVLFLPVLKLISVLLSPWRDPHTIFILARKNRSQPS